VVIKTYRNYTINRPYSQVVMLTLKMWYCINNMTETPQTPTDPDQQLLSSAADASKNLEAGYTPALPAEAGNQDKMTVRQMWQDLTPKERRTGLIRAGTAVGVVAAIAGGGAALSQHADNIYKNTIQQPDPFIPHDFENGPTPPTETAKPSPNPSEIPSPTQPSIDVQLGTVPNDGTDLDK